MSKRAVFDTLYDNLRQGGSAVSLRAVECSLNVVSTNERGSSQKPSLRDTQFWETPQW